MSKSEKQNIKLEKVDNKTAYENLLIKYAELEKQVKDIEWQLQEVVKDNDNYQAENKRLEQQIEKMKCCGNCRFSESDALNGTFCHREGCFVVASAKCKLWEM